MATMRTPTELRDDNGSFLGLVTMTVPKEWPCVRLPVVPKMSAVYTFDPDIKPASTPIIELEPALWRDGHSVELIWRFASGSLSDLANVSHVIVKGATEPTWYGRWVEQIELVYRLVQMLKFHNMEITDVVN